MSLKKQAKNIQKVGFKNSGQDSMLAHISPLEAMMLKANGGSGRTDPKTGLLHFDDWGGGYGGSVGGDSGGYGGSNAGDTSAGDTSSYGDQPGDYDMPSNDQSPDWAANFDPADWNTSEYTSLSDTPMSPADWNTAYGNYEYNPAAGINSNPPAVNESPDLLSRVQKFVQQQLLGKVIGKATQNVPGLSMAIPGVQAAIQGNVAEDPNVVGRAMVPGMLNSMAFGIPGMVSGLANLAGFETPNLSKSMENLSYQGNPAGTSGFGNSTTGQTGTGGSGINFDNVLNGAGTLAGLYGQFQNYRQNSNQANSLSSMFGPNSPYAQQLKQSLERRDAARGRRSQYGPREVELQAKLAQMASGVAPSILASRNAGNKSLMDMLGMMTSANKLGVFDPVKGWLGGMFGGNSGGFTAPETPYSAPYDSSTNFFSTGFGT